ncbi:MAG: hypothetical protein KBC43_11880 [Bacteroidales bacterium]|nr:hypothetical protein [Bacteroidales bacterium]
MKRINPLLIVCFLMIQMIFSGCAGMLNDVAKEDLLGKYSGTVEYTSHLSEFNVGLEDFTRNEKCQVTITELYDNIITLNLSDFGLIQIQNITASSNGCAFDIPNQKVLQENKTMASVEGTNEFTIGEVPCDGIYDNEKKVLNFAFKGILPLDLYGEILDTPISGSFELKKME